MREIAMKLFAAACIAVSVYMSLSGDYFGLVTGLAGVALMWEAVKK